MDIKKTFDEEANEYDNNSRAVNIYFDEALDELVSHISLDAAGRGIILDVCCGTGILTSKAASRFPNATFVGVDFSEGMVAVAKNRLKKFDFNVFLSDICDTENMKKLPMCDAVISSFGVHNVHGKENKQIALKNIVAHLKPGGQLIFCDILKGRDLKEQKRFDDFQRQWLLKSYSQKEADEWMNLLAEEDDPMTLEDNFAQLKECGCKNMRLIWKKEFLAIWEAYKE